MATQTTQASAAVPAFVMKEGEKFVCVIDKERIGVSKHWDYFQYHLRRGDVKALKNANIEKFVYVDETGTVTKVVTREELFADSTPAVAPTAAVTPATPAPIKVSAEIKKAASAARAVAAAH